MFILFHLDELVRVSERLEGAFSLANVVDPIEVTISDAIMNFQTHSDSLSTQVFYVLYGVKFVYNYEESYAILKCSVSHYKMMQ